MNEVIKKDNIIVENMIYEIRGKQVMLDSDLAQLYHCKNGTKEINQAIKNNIDKFPERFAFRINEHESLSLKSKNLTSNGRGGSRKGHTVFTEQGVAMLATILKTPVATEVSIRIMDAFVAMRNYISNNLIEQKHYNEMVLKHDDDIKKLQEFLNRLSSNEKNEHIFFEGQIYDAYSKIIDIFNTAIKKIIIIDNYLDKNMLDIISKSKVEVLLITANKLDNLDLIKYNNLTVMINNTFHDRFIIIDNKIINHLGCSLNYIGKKCFAISKINDKDVMDNLIKKIKV